MKTVKVHKPCDQCICYPICQNKTIWEIVDHCKIFEDYAECIDNTEEDWLIQDWNKTLKTVEEGWINIK